MIRPIKIANDVYSGVRKVVRPIRRSQRFVSLAPKFPPFIGSCRSFLALQLSLRQDNRSDRSGSHMSGSSSLSITRAKEAARIAELKAEAAAFKKR